MALFIFLPASDCGVAVALDLTAVTMPAAICASAVLGRRLSTLGHDWAVVGASSQPSQPSFRPRREIEIPAMSTDDRNVPAKTRSTVKPFFSRKGTTWRA